MILSPAARKLVLTLHVILSVGWLGTVATFLTLNLVGVLSADAQTVRAAYIAMNVVSILLIIPLSFGSLVTGLIEGLGTSWGLVRHYWVVTKLLLTLLATGLLLLHQDRLVSEAARKAIELDGGTAPSAGRLGLELVISSGLGVLALLTATILSLYKPRGMTPYGLRMSRSHVHTRTSRFARTTLIVILATICLVFTARHLMGVNGH